MENCFINQPQVLVLCQLFYPELVSTGQTLTELCEVLSDWGADVEVVCGPLTVLDQKTRVSRNMEYKGIKIKRVWGTRFPKLRFLGKLFNQVTYAISLFFYLLFDFSKRPILVLTNPPFLGAICAIQRVIGGKPFIYLAFDIYPDTAIKLGVIKENGLISGLWDRINRFILKQSSAVIVLGRCMKKVILSKGKGINSLPEKIHVIHIWSDDRHIHPADEIENPYTHKWNLDGKFVVSYSGNMGRVHDMETIMGAARELRDNQYIVFLFIGEGYKKQWMIDYARNWKLANCQFHTYVERKEIGYSLSCANIGLVSLVSGQEGLSVPSKTFGILAAGVPVIAIMSANSEIALVVKENDCGIVVEPGDIQGLAEVIVRLCFDSELAENFKKNALNTIQARYNIRNAAEKYFSIIRSLQY